LKYVFGPVKSRRLGISLGINHIPYKVCTYSCVYCQLGRTLRVSIERKRYSDAHEILDEVSRIVRSTYVDYVTFVPDGEPTLDTELGKAIRLLKERLGVRTAVLTNASLLWMEDVRADLAEADLVSVKVDAGSENMWRRVNRPHPRLKFDLVIEGVMLFAKEYKGVLISETMLVRGLNDSDEELRRIASILLQLKPSKAYIAVPVRPPAEPWVEPPEPERLAAAYSIFEEKGLKTELLASLEPPPPITPEDVYSYVASTVLVHPLRLSYVEKLAKSRGIDFEELLEKLSKEGIEVVEYRGEKFLVKRPRIIPR
jgi:wyosine [tRNA(Phe)-imidazoG37] synthetase (radical SAM superfamily)